MASLEQTILNVQKGGTCQVGQFGCNGKQAQSAVTVNAATSPSAAAPTKAEYDTVVALLNQLRAALIAAGVCV